MKLLDVIAAVLLIIGGLNWGLVGLFEFDLVATIFGGVDSGLARIIFVLVGLSAAYQVVQFKGIQCRWSSTSA
jgi:uncharacterized membrane protein YuzA (DUF378 family)